MVLHREAAVHWLLNCWLNALGQLFFELLLQFLLLVLLEVERLLVGTQAVVELEMNQVAVQIGLQQFGSDQILAVQVVELLLTHKPILIVHHLAACLLQLLSHIFQIGYPPRGRSQLRDEEASDFWIFQGCKHKPTSWNK